MLKSSFSSFRRVALRMLCPAGMSRLHTSPTSSRRPVKTSNVNPSIGRTSTCEVTINIRGVLEALHQGRPTSHTVGVGGTDMVRSLDLSILASTLAPINPYRTQDVDSAHERRIRRFRRSGTTCWVRPVTTSRTGIKLMSCATYSYFIQRRRPCFHNLMREEPHTI